MKSKTFAGAGLQSPALEIETQAHTNFVLRRLSRSDGDQYVKLISDLTPSDRRFRFFSAIRELPDSWQSALTDVDQIHHAAFAAEKFNPGSEPELCGVVRLVETKTPGEVEFAIVVAPSYRNCGLGYSLMEYAIAFARHYNIKSIVGAVHSENNAMLKICRELGFSSAFEPGSPSTTSVTLTLS